MLNFVKTYTHTHTHTHTQNCEHNCSIYEHFKDCLAYEHLKINVNLEGLLAYETRSKHKKDYKHTHTHTHTHTLKTKLKTNKQKNAIYLDKTQSENLRGSPLHQATKRHLTVKWWKNDGKWDVNLNHLSVFGWAVLFSCPVFGRTLPNSFPSPFFVVFHRLKLLSKCRFVPW